MEGGLTPSIFKVQEMQVPLQIIGKGCSTWGHQSDIDRARAKTTSCVSKMVCGAQQQDAANLATKLSRAIFDCLREEIQVNSLE